jgi:hypothetical protein
MKNLYVINGKAVMAYSLQEALILATPKKV